MEMTLKVHLTGMEAVNAAIKNVSEKADELRKAAIDLQRAISAVGLEENQPSADANG